MSWEQGEPTERRSRRAPVVIAGIVLAVLLLGLLTRQATPSDTLDVETEPLQRSERERTIAAESEPPSPSPIEEAVGPPLPGSGLTLYAVNTAGTLARVDLETGEATEAEAMNVRAAQGMQLVPADDGVVVVPQTFDSSAGTPTAPAVYVPGPDQPPVLLGSAQQALLSPSADRIWLVEPSLGFGAVVMREWALDGTMTSEATLPPGVFPYAAVDGGLLVDAAGTLLVYDPETREGRRVGDGRVLAADARRVPAEPDPRTAAQFYDAFLSPDGRWVAFLYQTSDGGPAPPRLAVLDLGTGLLRPAPEAFALAESGFGPFGSAIVWSPGGDWLFALNGSEVGAWNVEDGTVVPIHLELSAPSAIAVS